jgi:hypothetical protein
VIADPDLGPVLSILAVLLVLSLGADCVSGYIVPPTTIDRVPNRTTCKPGCGP